MRVKRKCQPACKPGSVWSCLRDGHSSGTSVTGRLKQPTRVAGLKTSLVPGFPHAATPIWSCSGWGLPCRFCYQSRGALLPHRFTLTTPDMSPAGGLFSVALSLGSPPAAVSRHPVSWSPDFPPPALFMMGHNAREPAATVQPADTRT